MTATLIRGGSLYTSGRRFAAGAVLFEDGVIRAAGDEGSFPVPDDVNVIDAAGGRIIPGLIDVHIHGAGGYDSAGGDLPEVIRFLPAHGVTAFLPTTYIVPRAKLCAQVGVIARIIADPPPGAQALGIHMEGPWFAPNRSGMADPALFYPLTCEDIEDFQQVANGLIRMATFAPEQGDALDAIPCLLRLGIIPTMGHTDADYDTIHRAVALGLKHATHTYNAMRGLHHREPGALGAVFDHDAIVAQLIADGHHVHPAAMRLLIRAKGIASTCLVSDAAPSAGAPPGEYDWEGYTIYHDGETSRLADGTLAGSVTLVNRMLRVLVKQVGLRFRDALRTATEVPADLLGVRKGRLEPGFDADIAVLGDDYQPILTLIGGRQVFPASG
jgi:N-acetylglucosamine-6-phosphate deacetylase